MSPTSRRAQRSDIQPLIDAVAFGPTSVADELASISQGVGMKLGYSAVPTPITIVQAYETVLSAEERSILRDGVVLLIETAADNPNKLRDGALSDLLSISEGIDLLQFRTQRVIQRLDQAWKRAATNGATGSAARILGVIADTGPIRPFEWWVSAHQWTGPLSTVPVLVGIARSDVARSLKWLALEHPGGSAAPFLAAALPELVLMDREAVIALAVGRDSPLDDDFRAMLRQGLGGSLTLVDPVTPPLPNSEDRESDVVGSGLEKRSSPLSAQVKTQVEIVIRTFGESQGRQLTAADYAVINAMRQDPPIALGVWEAVTADTIDNIIPFRPRSAS